MQMSHVMQAERRSPPLDVAFSVFQARRLAEDNGGSQNQMSALNRCVTITTLVSALLYPALTYHLLCSSLYLQRRI